MLNQIKRSYSNAYKSLIKNQYKILRVEGPDTIKLLNNIVTTNVEEFVSDQKKVALQSMLLESKGRIISDFIINKPQEIVDKKVKSVNEELWLKIPTFNFEQLRKQLMIYKLGKKVLIEDVSHLLDHVYLVNNTMSLDIKVGQRYEEFYENALKGQNLIGDGMFDFAAVDPRSPLLGHYIISVKENKIDEYFKGNKQELVDSQNSYHYDMQRYMRYIFEGEDIVNTYPLTVNADYYNSIDFKKGCYVGQEVSARANYTSIVYKRLSPFIVTKVKIPEYEQQTVDNVQFLTKHLDQNFNYNLSNSIYKENGLKKLLILKNVGNLALGMLKYDRLGPQIYEMDGLFYHRVVHQPFDFYLQEKLDIKKQLMQ